MSDGRAADVEDWERAVQVVESALEGAARLLDGDEEVAIPAFPLLQLSETPDPATLRHLRGLMADLEQMQAALADRHAETAEALEHTTRLRRAGRGYLSH